MSRPVGLAKAAPPGKAPPGKAPPPLGKAPPPGKAPPGRPRPAAGASRPIAGPRLRPLFWTTVLQVPPDSVFSELATAAAFDAAQVERQFTLAEPRAALAAAANSRRGPAVEEPRKRIRVLDDRTSQLLAIAFNRLPPAEQLVMEVDAGPDFPEGLPAEGILALHSAATEQSEAIDQIRQLDVLEGDLAKLDTAERYLWVLGTQPARAAKLACAAVLLGPARELGEMRANAEKVHACCQAMRQCSLLRKCISTGLALGNFVNRGTPRCNARAVVLPEALLKLEELRAAQDAEEGAAPGRSSSLLDFLAQALVDDSGSPSRLLAEAEELRDAIRAAHSCALEDSERTSRQILSMATRSRQALREAQVADVKLIEKISWVCGEAEGVVGLVQQVKEELLQTQAWSSARTKSEEWQAGWAHFLEQLVQALSRTKATATAQVSREPGVDHLLGMQVDAWADSGTGAVLQQRQLLDAQLAHRAPTCQQQPPPTSVASPPAELPARHDTRQRQPPIAAAALPPELPARHDTRQPEPRVADLSSGGVALRPTSSGVAASRAAQSLLADDVPQEPHAHRAPVTQREVDKPPYERSNAKQPEARVARPGSREVPKPTTPGLAVPKGLFGSDSSRNRLANVKEKGAESAKEKGAHPLPESLKVKPGARGKVSYDDDVRIEDLLKARSTTGGGLAASKVEAGQPEVKPAAARSALFVEFAGKENSR